MSNTWRKPRKKRSGKEGSGGEGVVGRWVAYLGGEVLEDGGEVDGGAGADALGVAALLEEAADAADGELEPGLDGAGHGLLPVASLPSGHLASPANWTTARDAVVAAARLRALLAVWWWVWSAGRAGIL
jgi:hypothetical protein